MSAVSDLEDVSSRLNVCNIDPLTVDVCAVGVVTSRTQTLRRQSNYNMKLSLSFQLRLALATVITHLRVGRAGVAAVVSRVAGRVLQTETGFMTLRYSLLCAGVQQVVMAELIHAVIVTEIHNKHSSVL